MTLPVGTKFTYLGEESDDTNYYLVNDQGTVDHICTSGPHRDLGTVEDYYDAEGSRIISEPEPEFPRKMTNSEIKKGDKLTYLDPESALNHYIAESDYDNGVKLRLVSKDGHDYGTHAYDATSVRPEDPVTLLERTTAITNEPEEGNNTMNTTDTALDAKLDLAVDYELRVKFNYTNERGETADRRLKVEDYDGEYVSGQSFDSNGYNEGFKRFRTDRINGKVTVQ
jgi:hypothetical protein